MTADREAWCLVLEAEPGPVPVGRRVAQVLKHALRVHGLKCIEASSMTPAEQVERLTAEVLKLRERLARAERKVRRATSCPA